MRDDFMSQSVFRAAPARSTPSLPHPADSVLDVLPRSVVKQNAILPLFADDDVLLVACAYEPAPELEEEIRLRYGMPMRAVLATPLAVNQALAKYYAPGMRDEAVADSQTASEKAAAGSSKSKKSKQSAPKQRKPASQMSDEEKRQQMLLGVIIPCWSTGGAAAPTAYVKCRTRRTRATAMRCARASPPRANRWSAMWMEMASSRWPIYPRCWRRSGHTDSSWAIASGALIPPTER